MLDDLLDLTASEAELGKPVGNDLGERKMTIPLVLGLESGKAGLRDAVARYYRSDDADPSAVADLLRRIAGSGGLERTREAIVAYVERAKMSLAPLGKAPARAELAAIADSLGRDGARKGH